MRITTSYNELKKTPEFMVFGIPEHLVKPMLDSKDWKCEVKQTRKPVLSMKEENPSSYYWLAGRRHKILFTRNEGVVVEQYGIKSRVEFIETKVYSVALTTAEITSFGLTPIENATKHEEVAEVELAIMSNPPDKRRR